ncbi:MAG TPA: tripartite tricarboxylate transporter substrate binding protein [Burkholderiaceae bacterium]
MNRLAPKMSRLVPATLLALACALFASVPIAAWADSAWPARPVRLIVPFPPGGGSDAVGRLIGQKLAEQLGQQVIIDNRAGAGGSLGTEAAVRAAPDGYTMVLASTSEIAINPSLYSHLGYDTVKDLVPVALVATTPMVLIVNMDLPVKSVPELIALARAKPGELNVASAGIGTISHLSGEMLRSMSNLSWTHVPYRGTSPALSDLVGGQVQLMFLPPPPAIALVKGNHARLIAVSGKTRAPGLPDTPTVAESGLPDYNVDNWYGIFMPVGTPQAVVARMADEVARALKVPDTVGMLASQGAAPGAMSTPQFSDYVKAEVAKWSKVVKSSGAKAE